MSIFREFFTGTGGSGIPKPKYAPPPPPPTPSAMRDKPNCRAYMTKIEMEIADAILIQTENLLKDPSEKAVGRLDGLHMAFRISQKVAHDYEKEVRANRPFPPSTYTTGIL